MNRIHNLFAAPAKVELNMVRLQTTKSGKIAMDGIAWEALHSGMQGTPLLGLPEFQMTHC
jgi:hypothetical protein